MIEGACLQVLRRRKRKKKKPPGNQLQRLRRF
jgi:hypothetical protein